MSGYSERVGQEWGTIYEQSPPSTPWPPAASDIILEDGFNFLAEINYYFKLRADNLFYRNCTYLTGFSKNYM